jgi:uncharacterized protein YjdB
MRTVIVWAIACAALSAACDKHGNPVLLEGTPVDRVVGVVVLPPLATLFVGDTMTATATATVTVEGALSTGVQWTSSDPGIASVDSSGKITAVSPGKRQSE